MRRSCGVVMALVIVLTTLVVTFLVLSVTGSEAMSGPLEGLRTGKLIIDTDAGVDDAVALFLALGFESKQRDTNVRVIAVTCVFGNTNLDNVVLNVLKVLKTANRLDIPVYRGADRSLLLTPPIADFYGADGLGDFVYPDPPNPGDFVKKEHASMAMVRLVNQFPKQVTVLCLGPLTNVALAIKLDPAFLLKVKQVVILGGSTEGVGNVMPGIEFNFYVDPEANFIVFNSVDTRNEPLLLLPWESVVKRNLIPMEWRRDTLGNVSSPSVRFLNLAERANLEDPGQKNWACADPLATAVALDASLVKQTSGRLHAVPEWQGVRARGSLLVDYGKALKDAPLNVVIVTQLDVSRYKKMLLGYLM